MSALTQNRLVPPLPRLSLSRKTDPRGVSCPRRRRRRRKKTPPPLPLTDLIKKYRLAFVVYGVLREMAGSKRQLNRTRRKLAERCGMDKKTISRAVSVLHDAGWIIREYGSRPEQNRKWYRITLAFDEFLPLVSATSHSCVNSSAKSPQAAADGADGNGQTAPQATSPPKTHATDPSAVTSDPSNGSKGCAPLDPSDGSNSLERVVGGGPPSAPPTLRCGLAEGTPRKSRQSMAAWDELPVISDEANGATSSEDEDLYSRDVPVGLREVLRKLDCRSEPERSSLRLAACPGESQEEGGEI